MLFRSNIYNQSLIASFIAINGKDKTFDWTKNLVKQMAKNPKGNDRDQVVFIKDNEGDIAIANSYYYGRLFNEKNSSSKYYGVTEKTSLYFTTQNDIESGSHINIICVGVIKTA